MSRKEIIGDCRKRTDGSIAIYALCEAPNDRPRYIGKTEYYMHVRHRGHIRSAHRGAKTPVARWIRKQERLGKPFIIKLIEYVPQGGDWAAREKYWIEKTRGEYPDCLNLCDGGEGQSGIVWSNERKKKLSDALKTGKEYECANCNRRFYRKNCAAQKNNFCSRGCYQKWQRGKTKLVPEDAGRAGRAAALAKKKAQTHCKAGHTLSGENLYINPRGSRVCKECRKEHKREFRRRNS